MYVLMETLAIMDFLIKLSRKGMLLHSIKYMEVIELFVRLFAMVIMSLIFITRLIAY